MIPVPLLNPKFANGLPARLCELRVRGTGRQWSRMPYCKEILASGTRMATRKDRVRASTQASERKTATFGELSKLSLAEAVTLARAARASPEALAGLANRGYSEQEIFELVVPK